VAILTGGCGWGAVVLQAAIVASMRVERIGSRIITAQSLSAQAVPAALAGDRRARYRAATMSVSPEQVRHIANLARIAMSEEEIERLVPEINNILGWVEQLGEVDTDGVEPLTAVIEQKLRLRDDKVTDGDCRDEVLSNAPDAEHGFFAVPKVIE
jgi:aspartyl-tRNA(Asn)/glutamyl-tRNA(Gln) amidotransferase subunit C